MKGNMKMNELEENLNTQSDTKNKKIMKVGVVAV
jgi:hypothetical protein